MKANEQIGTDAFLTFWPDPQKKRKHAKAKNVKKLETNYFHSLDLLDNLRKEFNDDPDVEPILNPSGPAEDSADNSW